MANVIPPLPDPKEDPRLAALLEAEVAKALAAQKARPTGFWPTVRHMGQSRRGIAAMVATVVGTVHALGLMASYFQGKMTTEVFFDNLKIVGGYVGGAWALYQLGTAYEDGQEKAGPKNINAAEGSNVQVNTPATPTEEKK
jgi:hypothetical protein